MLIPIAGDVHGPDQAVLLREVVIEPSVKMECVSKLLSGWHTWRRWWCGGGSKTRGKCAWAKFKELSPIWTARGASYHIKGKIYIMDNEGQKSV